MTQWKIDPQGVQGILTSVDTDRGDLGNALTDAKFGEIFDGLTWGGGITSVVPTAVNSLLEDQSTNLTNISNRINAGIVGVSNATIAYSNGQVDMAGTFQAEAVNAAETGNFQYFIDNGYQSK